MLKEKIGEELKNAMKSKDEKLTMVLRNLRAKIIELEKKDLNATVNDADLVSAFVKLAKERKESAEVYAKANRQDLADAELYELSIIEQYLPKQMSVEEIEGKVKDLIIENGFCSIKDMGKAIKTFNEKYAGMADGKTVSELVKKNLA
jgi:uncharacterized protein YqeY